MPLEACASSWTAKLNDRLTDALKQNTELETKVADLNKQNAELVAANAKLTEDVKKLENAPQPKTGVIGLPVKTSSAPVTPHDAYWAKVKEVQRDDKLTRAQAQAHVNKNYPELVQAMYSATA